MPENNDPNTVESDFTVGQGFVGELRSFLVDTYRGVWPPTPVDRDGCPAVSMREADVEMICVYGEDALAVELLLPRRIRKSLHAEALASDGWRVSSSQSNRLCFDVQDESDLEHLEEALLAAMGPEVSRCT